MNQPTHIIPSGVTADDINAEARLGAQEIGKALARLDAMPSHQHRLYELARLVREGFAGPPDDTGEDPPPLGIDEAEEIAAEAGYVLVPYRGLAVPSTWVTVQRAFGPEWLRTSDYSYESRRSALANLMRRRRVIDHLAAFRRRIVPTPDRGERLFSKEACLNA